MPECPYCKKECEARGLKNHIRLASGEHGPRGEIPDDFDAEETAESNESPEAPEAPEAEVEQTDAEGEQTDAEAAEVTADDLGDTEPEQSDSGESEDDDSYPFDPDSDDAIEMEGDENLYISYNGSLTECTPSAGDYLLITDNGPVLWDHETDERYEVLTA